MADLRITCITKPNVNSAHEHITHVGGPQITGRMTREEVIRRIDNRTDTFYVMDGFGRRSEVGVVRTPGIAAYIRTHADGTWNNNLLSLPQCP